MKWVQHAEIRKTCDVSPDIKYICIHVHDSFLGVAGLDLVNVMFEVSAVISHMKF